MKDGKKVVITYGTYDVFHYGHQALLERAKALGDYLIVGITSDAFDKERGKLNVSQPLLERIHAVEETGLADLIVIEEYKGQKIADIQKYGVDIFTVGSDWEGCFDYLKAYCDVVYLERTEGVSSTDIRSAAMPPLTLGIYGDTSIAQRFVHESAAVRDVSITHCFAPDGAEHLVDAGLEACASYEELLDACDAVYTASSIETHEELIRKALECGKHVLCETPLALTEESARDLYALAQERGLVLMEALKTAFFPAFEHLSLLVASGIVGEVKDIDASFTQIPADLDRSDIYQGSFYDLASYVLLPVFELIGTDYADADITAVFEDNGFSTWSKCNLRFPTATATVRMGRGLKTEGDLIITGTDGYLYVPAPWWKTDYFEVRSEDLRDTKKYYYEYQGEGYCYELFEFLRRVRGVNIAYRESEVRASEATARLIELFESKAVHVLDQGKYTFGGGETLT